MTKTLSGGMTAMLATRMHTLAWGMKVVRGGDAAVTGWTSHDRRKQVTVDGGALWLEPTNAIDMSSIARTSGFGVDNLEVTVLAFDDVMTKVQLLEGLWDHSRFVLFQFDWATPANGVIPWLSGYFGNAKPRLGSFVIELRDLRQALHQDTTRITQANCDYDYGDPNTCTVDLGPHTYAGTVTSVASQRTFTASAFAPAAGTVNEGRINWLTGLNAGLSQKARTHATGGVITLVLPMLRTIGIGDTFNAIAGCAKTRAACIAYGNVLNFPGFDQKPTVDELTGGSVVAP